MAKVAINHLVQTMGAELAGHRINVNAINPGWTDTPGERAFYTEDELREKEKLLPWGRIGAHEDIGRRAVTFFASDDPEYITGSIVRVDGGYVVARSRAD